MSEKIYLSTSEDASNKMDKTNPSGTGTFSIDRAGSTTGARSFAFQGEASGDDSIAIGNLTSCIGNHSIAMGLNAQAQGLNTISIGESTTNPRDLSIAIGFAAVNNAPSSEGRQCIIIGTNANVTRGDNGIVIGSGATSTFGGVTMGTQSKTSGYDNIALGRESNASGFRESIAIGTYTSAGENQAVIGNTNVPYAENTNTRLIVGNGRAYNKTQSNCFRVTDTAVYAKGNYNASGADYAEMFEWADGNPNDEDRVGRFVTLDGEMISLAESEDVFILGIVSAAPSVCGDAASEDWQGRFKRDIFGRMLFEDIEIPAEIDEETGEEKIPAHTINWYVQNDDWDNKQEYTAREDRKEWDAVGLLGKLIMIDDGTAEVNGWVTAGEGGIAVKSDVKTKYRVMSRIDETHIKILIL